MTDLFDSVDAVVCAPRTNRTRMDADKGEAARDRGMGWAASNRAEVLALAQKAALLIAEANPERECDADAVFNWLMVGGYNPGLLGNAAGSVFKTTRWEFTGRWKPSVRVSNHARPIRVWRLVFAVQGTTQGVSRTGE